MVVSRSGLYSQPFVPVGTGWRHHITLDYGSSAEWEKSFTGASYVLDAELMRVQLLAQHDISSTSFFQIGLDLNGVFNGFADSAFDWYHSTIGVTFKGRENRPTNAFGYSMSLPGGVSFQRERPDFFLGDVVLGYGVRHGARNQTTLSISLPTSTAPAGYARETFSIAAIHTLRTEPARRFSFEFTGGLGYTPATGDLSSIQREVFNSASGLVRLRLSSRNSIYGNLFTHSAVYNGTMLPELENREVTGGLGWIGHTKTGRTWRIGFMEDFGPHDAGLDLILRFGVTW
jgi:hypothetical protein